jgi:ribosomal protein L34E
MAWDYIFQRNRIKTPGAVFVQKKKKKNEQKLCAATVRWLCAPKNASRLFI